MDMRRKKQIQPDEKIALKLTQAQRTLLLNDLTLLPTEYETAIAATTANEPVMLTLDELEDLGGYIAAEANHCDDNKKQKKLDAVFDKIQRLLNMHSDDEPPTILKIPDARKSEVIAGSSTQLAEWAATALIAAEQLGTKTMLLENFCLAPAQRDVLLLAPGVSKSIKNKLAAGMSKFTVAEVASMTIALAEDLLDGDARKQLAVLLVARHLTDSLQEAIGGRAAAEASRENGGQGEKAYTKPKAQAGARTLFQFKITLKETKPPIWRRIQVRDCTLDELHEHIQTAMGWTNSHLHRFEIGGKRYGHPELFEEVFEEFGLIDSTRTRISQIVPKDRKRYRFSYLYDFGDGWEHEVFFEGCPKPQRGQKYPLCVEGDRACPPEDVGGVGGYADFLDALADPRHERHEELLEWAGDYAPEDFDAAAASEMMKKGLAEWRG
jgi:hypothetical protein